jgi:hypothetical protein
MFKSLKEDKSSCSDYILDLLEFVQFSLLRVNSINRAKIHDIVKVFETMDKHCQELDDYCIVRTKEARRTDSGLSEIVEVADSADKIVVADSPTLSSVPGTHHKSGSFSSHRSQSKMRRNSLDRAIGSEQGRPTCKRSPPISSKTHPTIQPEPLGLPVNGAPDTHIAPRRISVPIEIARPSSTNCQLNLPRSGEIEIEPQEVNATLPRGDAPDGTKHEPSPSDWRRFKKCIQMHAHKFIDWCLCDDGD